MKTSELCERVLNKTLLEPCDHKRRSHREVGCVVADIEDAVAQAKKDEVLIDSLLDVCKKLLWKCRCRGTGKYVTECTLCGDSTWDHHCNDEERECSDEACAAARKLISEAEVRG